MFVQSFLGIGYGATRYTRRGALAAGSAAVGVLASRFAAEDKNGYWLLGAGLSFAFGLDISELAHAP